MSRKSPNRPERLHFIRGVLPREKAAELGRTVIAHAAEMTRVVYAPGDEPGWTNYGEGRAHYVARPGQIDLSEVLDMDRLTAGTVTTLARDLGHKAADFIDPEHTYTVKLYAPGDYQGMHRDTNPVTVLMFLTESNSPDFPGDPEWSERPMQPGDVAVFDGRVPHCVHTTAEDRVTVVWSLYTPEAPERPEWADTLVYG